MRKIWVRPNQSLQEAVSRAEPGDILVLQPGVHLNDITEPREGVVIHQTESTPLVSPDHQYWREPRPSEMGLYVLWGESQKAVYKIDPDDGEWSDHPELMGTLPEYLTMPGDHCALTCDIVGWPMAGPLEEMRMFLLDPRHVLQLEPLDGLSFGGHCGIDLHLAHGPAEIEEAREARERRER